MFCRVSDKGLLELRELPRISPMAWGGLDVPRCCEPHFSKHTYVEKEQLHKRRSRILGFASPPPLRRKRALVGQTHLEGADERRPRGIASCGQLPW